MASTQLPLPLFACPHCGAQEIPRVQLGIGPTAQVLCVHCGHFLRYVPRRLVEHAPGKETMMAGGVNRTILLGTISRYGIEIRYTNSNATIATFLLACPEVW